MNLLDTHTHCEFSPDSRMTMDEAVRQARTSGLAGIIFTDHEDIDVPSGNRAFLFDPALQQQKIDQVKEKYGVVDGESDFKVLKGIEIGLQVHTIGKASAFVGKYNFDTIIASVHYLDGFDPYHDPYYDNKDINEAYGRYLEVIYDCISRFGNFDVLGHYDYITRYAPYKEKAILYSRFGEIVDQILLFLAKNGKALEINSNTYRDKKSRTNIVNIPYPDPQVLKRFKELGGEAVALASDAHDTWRIAEKFGQYTEFIKSCGFRYIAHFENRQARFTSI